LVDQSAKERNPRVETKLQGKTQHDQYKTEYDENQKQGKKGLKERNEDINQSYNNNQQGSAISKNKIKGLEKQKPELIKQEKFNYSRVIQELT
ncbi:5036_t:CDS:2, partial [Entrophospora sp. SA101]